MNAQVEAIRELLEDGTDTDITVDESAAKPLTWRAMTLYVYSSQVAEVPIETGPTVRRDFTVSVVLTGYAAGEEADQRRSADLSDWLDGKREAYLEVVRDNQVGTAWHHLRAAEDQSPSNLELRALALRLTGYVIVS